MSLYGWIFEKVFRDLQILKVVLIVVFDDLPEDSAGVADGDAAFGDVFGYYTSGSDYGVVADRYSGDDYDSGSDPAVSADRNGGIVLIALFTQFGQDGMTGGSDRYIGTEHGVIAYVNVGIIYHGQVEVSVDIFAEMDMMSAPVGMKRRFYIAVFTNLGKHSLKQTASFGGF